jgi:uncharacterized protein YigE (DUF2233 family)
MLAMRKAGWAAAGIAAAVGIFVPAVMPDEVILPELEPVILSEAVTPPEASVDRTVEIEGKIYSYLIIRDVAAEKLELIPNYESKLTTQQMLAEKKCQAAVNAGFYDTDNRPLGWLVIAGEQVTKSKHSSLFNGFVTVATGTGEIKIVSEVPDESITYGLQTGPVLIKKGLVQKLNMIRDKLSRRAVIAVDELGKAVFWYFFSDASGESGPLLFDLPQLVAAAANEEKIVIRDAINLDGGSASVFVSKEAEMYEIAPVGSWWCVAE